MSSKKSKVISLNKKRNLLPSIYNGTCKTDFKNYERSVPGLSPTLPQLGPHSLSQMNTQKQRYCTINYGKFDKVKCLENFTVPQNSTSMSKSISNSAIGISTISSHNVKYNSKEVEREIRKATLTLKMSKYSNIKNYNLADNNTLQKQFRNMNELVDRKSVV